jgi:mycothiol S-conjugate amidase
MASEPLCLLSVHAHPDDESSKGAGTVARYHQEGVKTVLVCCTGGEEGEILNPAMDSEEVRANLHEIRLKELAKAADVIGYDHVELLGYRDSGMQGSPSNENPLCFARADADDAVGKLVKHIRFHRPQVVLTYGDDQEFYPHPDHLRVHDISVAAFAAAGNAELFPDAGEPWQPSKLYYSVWSFERWGHIRKAFEEMGIEFPFKDRWSELPNNDHRITTRVNVADFAHARTEALRAHATQIDPESPFWFGLSPERERDINGEDDYVLAESRIVAKAPEDDLFAGLRGRS